MDGGVLMDWPCLQAHAVTVQYPAQQSMPLSLLRMEAANQQRANEDSDDSRAVRRTQSIEKAPFTVNDLQSELSSNPNLSDMRQFTSTPDSKPATNASNLNQNPFNPPTEDTPTSLWANQAAAAHSDTGTSSAEPAETADGYRGNAEATPPDQAEQQAPEPPSPASPVAATPLSNASTLEEPAESRHLPQHATPPEEHPPSSTEAEPDSAQEDTLASGLDNGNATLGTSSSKPVEQQAAPTAWSKASTSQSEASAGNVHTPGPIAQSSARDANPTSQQLQTESSWGADIFPAEMSATAAAPAVSTAASADVDSAGSCPQAQGPSEGHDTAGEAEAQQPTTDAAAALKSSRAAESHMSNIQSQSQDGDDSWADADFANVPAAADTDVPNDGSSSQQSSAMPIESHADESQWGASAFAAATAAPDAEQTASLAPSPQADAAVTDLGNTSVTPQAQAASPDWAKEVPSAELSASNVEVSASTAAAGEADTAAGAEGSEQPGTQQADEGDWGEDDFGDFNDAAGAGDDEGFGDFNEADTATPRSADASEQSPESRRQASQPSVAPAGVCASCIALVCSFINQVTCKQGHQCIRGAKCLCSGHAAAQLYKLALRLQACTQLSLPEFPYCVYRESGLSSHPRAL